MSVEIITNISDEKTFPHIGWPSEGRCVLLKDWRVSLTIDDIKVDLLIRKQAFDYDGLSAKKVAGVVQIEEGRSTPAWLVHDTLYITKGLVPGTDIILTKDQIDRVFEEMLRELGYGPRRSHLSYWGVRLFGGKVWRDNE